MKRKFGLNTSIAPHVIKEIDAIDLIKDAGFETIFTEENGIETICAMKDKCVKLGLGFDFVHSPFHGVNDLWTPGLDYLRFYNSLILSIDSAAAADINLVIMHVSAGWNPPQICDIGFQRFDSLVEYADKKGVTIAFENIRKLGNVAAILERYKKVPNVGYCYDCGHEHCYTETVPFLDLFHDQLLCTHLHDNFGRNKQYPEMDTDYHMLPFDGNIDYKDMMSKLDRYGYKGTLMLELEKSIRYDEMSLEEYVHEAYERVKRIDALGNHTND